MKVTNPETGKKILVGGSIYNRLLRQGYFLDTETYELVKNRPENLPEVVNTTTVNLGLEKHTFKTIVHLADIHFKGKMYDPAITEMYTIQFENLNAQLNNLDPKSTLIVIVGDIFHTGLNLESDTIMYAKTKVKELADKFPVLMTSGNHDISARFPNRVDTVQAVFSGFHKNVYIITKTGRYTLGNIQFDFKDLFPADNFSSPFGFPKTPNTINIALYHGTVIGSKIGVINENDNLISRISDDGLDPAEFNNYDLVLLGHIHSTQFISPTIAYSGSLVQQHFGEQQEHGFILWDLETKHGTFVDLQKYNKSKYLTLSLKAGPDGKPLIRAQRATVNDTVETVFEDFVNVLNDPKEDSHFDYKLFVRIIATLDNNIITPEFVDSIIKTVTQLTDTYNVTKYVHKECRNLTNTIVFTENYNINNLLIQAANNDEELSKELLRIHNDIAKDIDITVSNVTWNLVYLEWKNLFSYSKNKINTLHFTDDIMSIIAPNASGKTSILRIIRLAMFNDVSRKSLANVINSEMQSGYVQAVFIANNEKYTIKRTLTKSIVSGQTRVSTHAELTKITPETEVILDPRDMELLTGNSDYFDQNFVLNTYSNSNWTRMKPTALLEYFMTITDTKVFEKFANAATDTIKQLSKQCSNLEGKIDQIEESLHDLNKCKTVSETEVSTQLETVYTEFNGITTTGVQKPSVALETLNSQQLPEGVTEHSLLKVKTEIESICKLHKISLQKTFFEIPTEFETNFTPYVTNVVTLEKSLNAKKEELKFTKRVNNSGRYSVKPVAPKNYDPEAFTIEYITKELNKLEVLVKTSGLKPCYKKSEKQDLNAINNDLEKLKETNHKLKLVTQNVSQMKTELQTLKNKLSNYKNYNVTCSQKYEQSTLLNRKIRPLPKTKEFASFNASLETLEETFLSNEQEISKLSAKIRNISGSVTAVPLIEDVYNQVCNNDYTLVKECLESIMNGTQKIYKEFLENEKLKSRHESLLIEQDNIIANYCTSMYSQLIDSLNTLQSKYDSAVEKEVKLKEQCSKLGSKISLNMGSYKTFLQSCKEYIDLKQGHEDYLVYSALTKDIESLENEYKQARCTLTTVLSNSNYLVNNYLTLLNVDALIKQWELYNKDQESIKKREKLVSTIKTLETQLANIRSKSKLSEQLEIVKSEFASANNELKLFKVYKDLMHKGIPLIALKDKLVSIVKSVNDIMQKYTKYTFCAEINSLKDSLEIYFLCNESKLPYDSLSGCEKVLFQIAFIKSCSTCNFISQLLIIDEAFDVIDSQRFESDLPIIMNVLTELFNSTLLISHRKLPSDLLTRSLSIDNYEMHE